MTIGTPSTWQRRRGLSILYPKNPRGTQGYPEVPGGKPGPRGTQKYQEEPRGSMLCVKHTSCDVLSELKCVIRSHFGDLVYLGSKLLLIWVKLVFVRCNSDRSSSTPQKEKSTGCGVGVGLVLYKAKGIACNLLFEFINFKREGYLRGAQRNPEVP